MGSLAEEFAAMPKSRGRAAKRVKTAAGAIPVPSSDDLPKQASGKVAEVSRNETVLDGRRRGKGASTFSIFYSAASSLILLTHYLELDEALSVHLKLFYFYIRFIDLPFFSNKKH